MTKSPKGCDLPFDCLREPDQFISHIDRGAGESSNTESQHPDLPIPCRRDAIGGTMSVRRQSLVILAVTLHLAMVGPTESES